MDEKMVKVYAAYRSGCLGDNILHTYFRFFANIIYEQQWEEVNEGEVADAVKEKYGIDLPLPFVRQVLGVGMDNNAIVDNHGKYIAQRDVIRKFQFNSKDFDRCWDVMRSKFGYFCKKEKLDLGGSMLRNVF